MAYRKPYSREPFYASRLRVSLTAMFMGLFFLAAQWIAIAFLDDGSLAILYLVQFFAFGAFIGGYRSYKSTYNYYAHHPVAAPKVEWVDSEPKSFVQRANLYLEENWRFFAVVGTAIAFLTVNTLTAINLLQD